MLFPLLLRKLKTSCKQTPLGVFFGKMACYNVLTVYPEAKLRTPGRTLKHGAAALRRSARRRSKLRLLVSCYNGYTRY